MRKCKKLNRVGRPESTVLMPWDDSRVQLEEERVLFLHGEDSANEKPWNLFTISYKSILFPLLCRNLHPWLKTPKYNSLLIPNKLIFAGEIPVYLLEVMCTHTYIHTHTYAYAYRYTNIHTHTYELRCSYLCSFCLLAYLHNMANLWAYINSAKCLKRMIAPEETILYSFCCLPFKWPSSS